MVIEVGYAEGSRFTSPKGFRSGPRVTGPKGFGLGSSAEVSQVEVEKQPAMKLGIFLFVFCYRTIF